MATSNMAESDRTAVGPVIFAYDGSNLARHAIEAVAGLLGPGRNAVVLTVWHPFGGCRKIRLGLVRLGFWSSLWGRVLSGAAAKSTS